MSFRVAALAAMMLALLQATSAPTAPVGYKVTGSIAGTDGGWDYASIDPVSRRLFVAHGDAIMVVDLATGKPATLAKAAHAHAVLPIPSSGLILETEGDTGRARLIDEATGSVKAEIATGLKPDAAIWDAFRKRAVVMNGKSGTISVIDPVAAKVTTTVAVASGLEFAAFDRQGRLYVNNEDRSQIARIDLDHGNKINWIALKGCEGPTGMAYAATADRIVSACGNGVVMVVDPSTANVVASILIGKGADAVIADPARHRLFVPAGDDGTLTVLEEAAGGRITAIETVTTQRTARTGALNPEDGKLYLPAAEAAGTDAQGKRKMSPGSFHILIVSPTSKS